MPPTMMSRLMPCAGLLVALLAGCATPRMQVPEKLDLPPPHASATTQVLQSAASDAMRESPTPPRPESQNPNTAGLSTRDDLPAGLGGAPVSVNVSNLPIPAFVNAVLGDMLKLTFKLDPAVQQLTELVTLRTSQPQKPAELYRIARQVLGDYGIEMVADGNVVRLTMAAAGTRLDPPIVYSGRALPDVPITHRPVFYLMELQAIRSSEANRWLKAIYGDEVKAEEASERNALLISGRAEKVREAVEALRVFDRPYMRGRASIRLEPAFLSADQLAAKLTEMLVAEGYGASSSLGVAASVLILPVSAVNSVILFAGDEAVLRHAVDWAHQLDRPNPAAGGQSMFYYPVKNTKATDIASVLGSVNATASGTNSALAQQATPATATAAAQVPQSATTPRASAGRALIVDEPRNALIFQGDPAEWERLLPLIKQMDREARQVMIEMTIAEVTLDDNEEFGVSWFAKGNTGRFNGKFNFGTLPAAASATSGGAGLTYLLDVAGESRALLKAFADDSRVSILSTPRLMVKSGEEASIDVGTEVPTITARQTSPQQVEGNTGLLQSIQYRKTGILLTVKPTVYSDDRVDIELNQEVSEALPLGSDDTTGSPSIFNRTVKTSLSLRDGGSIVLGGLMSNRQTNTDDGVPYLKDVPLLGNLFKSKTRKKNKTELVLMIVPYIVGSDQRAQELTQAIGDNLQLLQLPKPLVPGATPATTEAAPQPRGAVTAPILPGTSP
jgi:general secretion pathway protein D